MTEAFTPCDDDLGMDELERRASPRLDGCLSYSISLASSPALAAAAGGAPKLVGHTRDLSEGGLAVIVPSLTFAYRHLLSPDFKLRLTLELPSGPIEIEGMPTHDRPLRDSDGDMHYMLSGELEAIGGALFYGYGDGPRDAACILGLKIMGMSDEDRTRFERHLRLLAGQNPTRVPSKQDSGAAKAAGVSAAPKKTMVDFWRGSNAAVSGYSYF